MIDAASFFLGAIWDNLIWKPNGFWVVLIALGFLCWRFKHLPWPALIPVAMFMVLYCFNEAWNLVETPPVVGFTTSDGEIVPFEPEQDAALTAALKAVQELIVPAAELQGVENAERLMVAIIYPENIESVSKAYEAYTAGIFGTGLTYATVAAVLAVLAIPFFGHRFAAFVFMYLVLVGAEWWTALVNWLGCEVLMDDTSAVEKNMTWGQTAAKSVCERETGGQWFEAVGMLIFVALMWLILERHTKVIRRFSTDAHN